MTFATQKHRAPPTISATDVWTPGDEIEIDGAGFVENHFRAPTEFTLQPLEFGQQGLGSEAGRGLEGCAGIDEWGRTGWAIHRFTSEQGRSAQGHADQGFERVEGFEYLLLGIPQVRAECHQHPGGG